MKTNRGPAAAQANRAALVDAARVLFVERGYQVPMSAIAAAASVGQGSLYRHFPQRSLLAAAVIDQNLQALEALAGASFRHLWRLVIDQLVEGGVFFETAVDDNDVRARLEDRFVDVLTGPLVQARATGEIADGVDIGQLLLVVRMVLGTIHTEPDLAARRRLALSVLRLVGRGLDLDPAEPEREPR